ncbi:MAG: hypothetical protein K2J10_09395, partial [Muribaculaceae bacterium]|nr:hypothetical protein [Muribaculaceae bacterium]
MSSIRDIFTSDLRLTIVFLSLLFATAITANAITDTLNVSLHYCQGSPKLEADYHGNDSVIAALGKLASSTDSVMSIGIVSSASPEGNTLFNRHLSELRSQTALSLVASLCNSVHISSIGINWNGLAERLEASKEFGFAESAAKLIRTTPEWVIESGIVTDSRKRRLMDMHGGATLNMGVTGVYREER